MRNMLSQAACTAQNMLKRGPVPADHRDGQNRYALTCIDGRGCAAARAPVLVLRQAAAGIWLLAF